MVLPWGSPTRSEPPHLWLFIGPWVMWSLVKITYLEWSPPKHSIYFYLTYILTSYLAFYLAYILWHIFWHFLWRNFLAGKRRRGQLWWNQRPSLSRFHQSCPLLLFLLTFYSANLMTFLLAAYVSGIPSGIFCILSDTSSEILCGWGPAGNTLTLGLLFGSGGEHCDLALAVEVQWGTLRSWACCLGPTGNTAISQLRSGREHEHSDPELAARVRQGTLRSSACSWGPAGNTLILSLLFGSGGEHCDLALALRSGGQRSDLAVWVRRGTLRSSACIEIRRWSLWSWACCPGPEGTRAIKSLQLRSGRDDFDPEVAVWVRRGPLRARVCSWGPAEEQEAEEAAGRRRWRPADMKSNNPQQTGGTIHLRSLRGGMGISTTGRNPSEIGVTQQLSSRTGAPPFRETMYVVGNYGSQWNYGYFSKGQLTDLTTRWLALSHTPALLRSYGWIHGGKPKINEIPSGHLRTTLRTGKSPGEKVAE